MIKIPDGYQNEFLFVLEFNNKRVKELNPMLRVVVDDIFQYIKEDDIVKSWKNHLDDEKRDIFIKINNQIRSISIKMGSRNSVHVESINSFTKFLKEEGISQTVIDNYNSFHYGKDEDDKAKILSAAEYSEKYPTKIEQINQAFYKINIYKVVDRFILKGKNSPYQVDGIIYGIPTDFIWINKNDIKRVLKNNMNKSSNSVHISNLFIQPLNRCINKSIKYSWCKDYVQVKWYSLFDDIIENMNNKKTTHKWS